MKKFLVFLMFAGVLTLFGCSSSDDPTSVSTTTLTVKTNLSISDKAGDPTLNDSPQTITLEFNSPLNMGTVKGEVKLYRMQAVGAPLEEPFTLILDENEPTIVNLAKKDGTKFTEGEEYKIAISQNVKSASGLSLNKAFEGYFATNYSFDLGAEGIKDLNNERSQIIVVSDIHMGADIRYSEFDADYGGNGAAFVDFLTKISQSPNVKELVIAGDLIDEWIVPGGVDTFGGLGQAAFVNKVAATHSAAISAIKNVIAIGVKVTYVIGNHDMLVDAADISRILPGINQAPPEAKGLGKYSPDGRSEIAIEHGHRYNIFAAPDPISKPGSILPPGYFFARVGTTSFLEGLPSPSYQIPTVTKNGLSTSQDMLYLYWKTWKDALTGLNVTEAFNDKFIVTNIDGYTEKYALADFYPYQTTPNGPIDVNLYKGIQDKDNWDARQVQNLVPVNIPVEPAIVNAAASSDLDDKAITQYFQNPVSDTTNFYYNKRIVIFGHSHEARIIPSTNLKSQKTIYANTGTWIDHNPLGTTMNFVVVTPAKSAGSAIEYVGLYQYYNGGNIRKMDDQALTVNP